LAFQHYRTSSIGLILSQSAKNSATILCSRWWRARLPIINTLSRLTSTHVKTLRSGLLTLSFSSWKNGGIRKITQHWLICATRGLISSRKTPMTVSKSWIIMLRSWLAKTKLWSNALLSFRSTVQCLTSGSKSLKRKSTDSRTQWTK